MELQLKIVDKSTRIRRVLIIGDSVKAIEILEIKKTDMCIYF